MTLADLYQQLVGNTFSGGPEMVRPVGQGGARNPMAYSNFHRTPTRMEELGLGSPYGAFQGPRYRVAPARMAAMGGAQMGFAMAPPAPKQYFSNDWSGMRNALANQQRLDARGAPSLASLLGYGGY